MSRSRADQERVVITGMGWITPLGHDLDSVWARLMAADSGMAPITRFDAATFPTSFAAEVKDFDVNRYVDDPVLHEHAGLNAQFALAEPPLRGPRPDSPSVASIRSPPAATSERGRRRARFRQLRGDQRRRLERGDPTGRRRRWAAQALERMNAWREIEQEPNMPLAHLGREFEVTGPAYNCLTACAASTQAIGEATDILRRGDADLMLSGGTHTMIHPLGVTGFNRLTALSQHDGDPTEASRPFDRTRGGFVMGEGSGMVVLETLAHAKARGATPLVEVLGYGSSCDAYRITDIQPDGRGAAAAMDMALEEANPRPARPGRRGGDRAPIDYISAHGTGTKENDSIETRAVKRVFGDLAPAIPMSSIKSMMGHLIAAAGSVELITSALAIERGMLPPTRNLHHPDPDLDLDYVPNEARPAKVDVALSNNFGFGGQNDTLVIARMSDA